jgi:hypothetical protein
MRTIRRLLPLLMLAACARPPAPAAAPPPPAEAGARLPIHIRLGMDPVPAQRIVYVVDGVEHTDSAFRALGLERDEIEWIEVLKCTDACTIPSRVILRTSRPARHATLTRRGASQLAPHLACFVHPTPARTLMGWMIAGDSPPSTGCENMLERILPLLVLSACAPAPGPPPAAPPPDAADLRARLKPSTPVIYVVDGVQHTDSSFRALDPLDIVSIEVPGGLNEAALPRTGPRYIYIRTRRSTPPPADSAPRGP